MNNYTRTEIKHALYEHLRLHTDAVANNSSLTKELYDWHLTQIRYYTLEIQKVNNRTTSKSYTAYAADAYQSIKQTIKSSIIR